MLPPSRSTLVRREGRECLGAFVCRVRARSFFSSSFGRWRHGSWLSCCRHPFPASPSLLTLPNSHRTFHDVRIRGSLQSLASAFFPPASHALLSVNRGRIRGLGHVSLALVDVAVALASFRSRLSGRERGRRSSSASRSSRGRSRCERSRSSDRYRSRRGGSRSRCAWSRSSDRYRSRRDRSRRERSRSFDRYRSRRERARSPARRGEWRGRSQSHARVTARGQACNCLLLLPACGLTAVSLACGLAFCGLPWRWRVATRVLMVAGFPLLLGLGVRCRVSIGHLFLSRNICKHFGTNNRNFYINMYDEWFR